MDIKQVPVFPHAFMLDDLGGSRSDRFNEVQEWCNENCSGRWMVFGGSSYQSSGVELSYCSKAEHQSPIPDEYYPLSSIKVSGKKLISFEEETDAMAFKLYYYQDPSQEYDDE